MKLGNLVKTIVLLGLLVAGGCEVPAQLIWSPDGKKAAWRKEAGVWIIDEKGSVVQAVDHSSLGGFAWSADSSTLFFAGARSKGEPTGSFEIRNNWIDAVPSAPASQPSSELKEFSIYMMQDGSLAPLFHIAGDAVWHMALSPDEQWLAVVAWTEKPDRFLLYAYSLESRHLYPISSSCGLGVCFTGSARLAYMQPDITGEDLDHQTGRLVEATLDDAAPSLDRQTLLSILPDRTLWLVPLGENLLLSARAQNFPGQPDDKEDIYNLYFLSRADGAVTAIANEIGPFFAPSPDGKRILYQKITPKTDAHEQKSELAVMNANGSDGRVLRDVTLIGIPMWPAWRGSDEITFVAETAQAKLSTVHSDHMLLDVVHYRLNGNGEPLEPIATLSQTWPEEMKPFFKSKDSATTQP